MMEHFLSKTKTQKLKVPVFEKNGNATIVGDFQKGANKIYDEIYAESRWRTAQKIDMVEEA